MKKQGFGLRFWQYLQERFPLHKNGALLSIIYTAIFFAGAYFAAARFNWRQYAAGLVVFILFFLQLRIMDEFKDFKDDSKYRPERPVPRGLVSLAELKPALVIVIVLELCGGFMNGKLPLIFIAAAIAYSFLMFFEFFIGAWLKKHIYIYALTHGIITVPVTYFAAASAGGRSAGAGLACLGLVVFLSLFAYEISRKVRRKKEEQKGVETYTKASGETRPVVLLVILTGLLLAAVIALLSAVPIARFYPACAYFTAISAMYSVGCLAYVLRRKSYGKGSFIEGITIVYILFFYFAIIGFMLTARAV